MTVSLGLQRNHPALLKQLHDPHLRVPIVHITGTNGKGSVSAFLDAILSAAGLRTGRFNSPHLVTVNDAITIQGKAVPLHKFQAAMKYIQQVDASSNIGATPF